MDVRAFGNSVYSYSASLPYTSGLYVTTSGQSVNFPACRAVYIDDGNSNQNLQVLFADCPGTPITLHKVTANALLPISITTISGAQTTVGHVVVLY
jgi:hypothetical protein